MKRFKDILCVVSGSDECKATLQRATTLAQNNQARLTVVKVAAQVSAALRMLPSGSNSGNVQDAMVQRDTEELETLVAPYRSRIDIQTKVLVGVPFLEIIREVLRNSRDLVIKTPETQAWLRRIFASDDMHLLRKCPCPVWLIKSEQAQPDQGQPDQSEGYQRILAAVDVSDQYPEAELPARQQLNRNIIAMATSLALSDFAELHIVHAWEAVGESTMAGAFMSTSDQQISAYVDQVEQQQQANLDQLMREATADLGPEALAYLKPQAHLVKGPPRKEIPELAARIEADLVVMGTVARTGIPGFIMGNTAETILNQIESSVLAIKPPGFSTPVTLED